MDAHEPYTIRLFFDGQRDFQEDEFFAASATAAYNYAVDEANKARANHFNINRGKIDREEPVETKRKVK